ncbi:MAG: sugar kinase [Alphaproteobacteria bacterium]|nr:sugar kinase [Alphaproteobacteria bacterium]
MIVCFGEMLVRLSAPVGEGLLQSARLAAHMGGAEANVAVSLARLGTGARMVSVLPDNALGHAARAELRRHGVDVSGLVAGPGRMGLYFLMPAASLRPAQVLYDRAQSAFARADFARIDWPAALAGARWLHLSGITPALGEGPAEAALAAAREAHRQGVAVSFDGNFRAALWAERRADPATTLRPFFEAADLLFVDERDVALVLGREVSGECPAERHLNAAAAAFEMLPRLARVAATVRVQHSTDDQELGAVMATRERRLVARPRRLSGIVDRIGAGDAFAAGLLHGLVREGSDAARLDFALAACCLKHAIAGDANLAGEAEIAALAAGGGLDVRR